MTYKILNIDQEKNVIEILVTWDDATTYTKRMMADTSSLKAIKHAVKKWMKDYLEAKGNLVVKADLTSSLNKNFTVTTEDLIAPEEV